MVAGKHVGADATELVGHEPAESRDAHRHPAYDPRRIGHMEPSGLESTLLTVGVIGSMVACIVVGLIALRNHRR
jgi:hypothetical protein